MRNQISWIFAILLIGFWLTGVPRDAKAATLSLSQAVQYGLEHSPEVNSRLRELEIRRLELRNSKSAFLPSLDLEATQGLQRIGDEAAALVGGQPDNVSRLSIALTETLYDNGVNWIAYKKAGLALDRAQLAYDEEKNRISLEIARAFLDYSYEFRSYEVEREQHELLVKQFKIVESRYRQGMKTKADYIRLNAQVLRSELRLQDGRTQIRRAGDELRRVLGVPLGQGARLQAESIGFDPLVLEDQNLPSIPAAPPALEDQLLWRISELDKKLEEQNVALVRKEYGPRFYLVGDVSYETQGFYSPAGVRVQGWSWNALATVRWNLWDWGARSRQVAIADNTKEIVFNRVASGLFSRRSEVEAMMLEFKRVSEYLRVNRELLKLERQSYNLVETEYRNGKADYLELVSALSNLASARLVTLSAVTSLHKAIFQNQYYQGTLHGDLAAK